MDLSQLKEAAIEATARALQEKFGVVPDADSDEWESEYRRQFALAKQRYGVATPTVARATGPALQLPELRGDTQELVHWAEQVRTDRLREVADTARRAWMAKTWTRAKLWVDTRDVPVATLLQRTQGQYDDYRRQQVVQKQAQNAAVQQKAAAVAAHQEKLRKAGITEAGLVELIDAAERVKPAALGEKLAELHGPDRHLRVFATADATALLVKEKNLKGQHDYGIEHDEGLVADLKLFASAP
jgi:mannitol/fructose-specific phosphotransferase system IIA component